MHIGEIAVHYISHVSFVFRSPAGAVLITDPFFAERFWWYGGFERYLTPPEFPPERITKCDVVFISHIHGDHFDPITVCKIRKQTDACVLAPYDVVDVLLGHCEPLKAMIPAQEGKELRIKDMTITAMAGYDKSFDSRGFFNKFSILIQSGDTRLFYSGDCHELPPAMCGKEVDAIFWWPHTDDAKIRAFCNNLRFKDWILMHGDRFEPGNFLCNLDMEKERQRVQNLVPNVNIIVPERLKEFPYA